MLVYGLLTIQAGTLDGASLLISSVVCAALLASSLASAKSVLNLVISLAHIVSRIFCVFAVPLAMIAAVFCCHASIAFSMLELTQQKP